MKDDEKGPHEDDVEETDEAEKKERMSARDSSPIRFFMRTAYTPYKMALRSAMTSPIASCFVVLWGNEPRFSSVLPERSTLEMRAMPSSEARTPITFLKLKLSIRTQVPKRRVHTPESLCFSRIF